MAALTSLPFCGENAGVGRRVKEQTFILLLLLLLLFSWYAERKDNRLERNAYMK